MATGQQRENRLTLICFFITGASFGFCYYILLTGAEDILSGYAVPTSMVVLSLSLPGFLVALTSPLFFDRIGNPVKVFATAFFIVTGLLIVALVKGEWKLTGVTLISVMDAFGEMTFLSFTSSFQDSAVGAYCAGGGLTIVTANLVYLALTVVLHVSPRAVVLGLSWIPLLTIVSYLKLRKLEPSRLGDSKTSHEDYKPVPLTEQENQPATSTRLSIKKKLLAIWKIMHHLVAFIIGLFAAFLSVQGITSTLVYKQTGLAPREVFVVYNNVFIVASSVGRAYSFVISLVNPRLKTHTKHTWALAIAEVALMLFLLIESWYRFFNSLVLVNLLLAFIGFVFGVLYVNVCVMVGVSDDAKKSAVTRAFTIAAWDGGMIMAGLMALYVEPIIQQRCLFLTDGKPERCLARSSTSVM